MSNDVSDRSNSHTFIFLSVMHSVFFNSDVSVEVHSSVTDAPPIKPGDHPDQDLTFCFCFSTRISHGPVTDLSRTTGRPRRCQWAGELTLTEKLRWPISITHT